MAAAKVPKRAPQSAPASGGDRIGALPNELLHRILSLLPAQQAVRTCVLARRWLDLWKSATGLRIVGADGKAPARFEEVREFVDNLLLLRGSSPLETFELTVTGAVIDVRRVRLWVSYAVQCKVRALRLNIRIRPEGSPVNYLTILRPEDPPLASRHLTKLELRSLKFSEDFLDFSRCPELQGLQIEGCSLENVERISSQSLRRLIIIRSSFNKNFRTQIHAPSLTSLLLEVHGGRTPVLERMPLLVKSCVVIFGVCEDCCSRSTSNYGVYGECGDASCRGCIPDDSACVMLHGMSQAKTLVLLATSSDTFIFRRDLKSCPTFNRLKSLTLNDNWCVPDERPLACILEHSPVLEKLILYLFCKLKQPEDYVKMKTRFNPKELPPTISSHLKGVEVICGEVDRRVLKVLKFLSKHNISFSFTE